MAICTIAGVVRVRLIQTVVIGYQMWFLKHGLTIYVFPHFYLSNKLTWVRRTFVTLLKYYMLQIPQKFYRSVFPVQS